MKLSTRLTLAMVALVLLTTGVLGFMNYQSVVSMLLPRALDRLQSQTRLSALVMDAALRGVRADVQAGQASEALRSLMAARRDAPSGSLPSAPEAESRKHVGFHFASELSSKPDYAIARLIGVEDGGLELVRVDRLGPNGSIRIAPLDQLTRRGDRAWFKQGIATPPNQVLTSRIELNRTLDGLEVPEVPTLRVTGPIHHPDGTPYALLVVNVDLRSTIARLRASASAENQIYLVNEHGDYLVHPDPSREFGFDRGRSFRVQDEFPGFAALLPTPNNTPQLIEDRNGRRFGIGLEWIQPAGGPRVAVIHTRPYAAVMAVQTAVRDSTLLGGGAALLVAMLMAIPLARSLTRTLVRITKAVEDFGHGESVAIEPGGGREIRVLAQAFSRMMAESQGKEAALREQIEERSRLADVLNNTINNMVDPVLVADADGVIIIANDAALRTFGPGGRVGVAGSSLAVEQVGADGKISPLPTEQWPLYRAAHGEIIENVEIAVRPNGGNVRSFLIANGRPLRNERDEIQGAVMVYHDVTKTRQIEEALRQSERKARAIVDTALDAFVQIDPAGTITEWSPQAEAMFGWPRQEVFGRKLGDVMFLPEVRAERIEEYNRFISAIEQGHQGYRIEVEAFRRDGSPIHTEVALSALKRDDGYLMNMFVRDLTERIVSEEQLRQSQKMESIGQLTGGIAHDFNNMLTVITGTIDILGEAVADKPQLASIARLISEAADRGAELTRLLLAFARKQPLQPCDTDVNTLIGGLQSLLRPTLGEQIEVETVLHPGTWPIFVDRSQLESALVNLAVNARDAMPNGGRLTLETGNAPIDDDFARRLGEVEPGPYVVITVSDSGSGIPEAIRAKVFDPFFTTKEVGKGTGLGLSMVYGFIKQSGGHITLYSEEGLGTTFRIYLPRAKSEPEQVVAVVAEAPAVGGTETILIVEDDAMVRNYVNAQLKSLGYTTLSVANAAAALSVSERKAQFDLLFTDIVMPGKMNGVELATEMARRRPGLRVLFTSGYTESAVVHSNRIDSDILLLSKPYRRADLARMVRQALTRSDRKAS